MKEWLEEVAIVLNHSTRPLWLLGLGSVGAFVILAWGDYQLSNFELSENMRPLGEVFKEWKLGDYEGLALFFLVSCWIAAFKLYIKNKKRLFSL